MSILFVISAPSGTGKNSLVEAILKLYASSHHISRVITYTTREKRAQEHNHIDYHFITKDEFLTKKNQQFFIETTEYSNAYYGTLKTSINPNSFEDNKIAILDRPGASMIKKLFPKAVLIWIYPESLNDLEKRLRSRNSENSEEIKNRLNISRKEIELEKEQPLYDYHIKNDIFEVALDKLSTIIIDCIENQHENNR